MRPRTAAAITLIATFQTAFAAQNWADSAEASRDYATSRAICQRSKEVTLPVVSPSRDKTCDSSVLLYGIGRPVDPDAARACATREIVDDPSAPTGGAGILTTIYANGTGVPRNYDFAIAYACRIDGAPAEMDGRIKHLAALRTNGPGNDPFDICDDITSGMMMGFCAERQSAIAAVQRRTDVERLTSTLKGDGKAAFARLQKAEQAFVASVVDNEVDVTGSGRGAFIMQARDAQEDAFLDTLRRVLSGKIESPNAAADKRLNAAYQRLMRLKDTSGLGTVGKKGVQATQRLWIAYRDAFVAFKQAAMPSVPSDAIVTDLTNRRATDLETLLGS